MRDSYPHMYTLIDTNMRYNPRTDNALSMEEIAKQCMDAVIAATQGRDDEYHDDINYGNLYPQGWSFQ